MYSGIAAFRGIKEWLELPGQSNLKIAPVTIACRYGRAGATQSA